MKGVSPHFLAVQKNLWNHYGSTIGEIMSHVDGEMSAEGRLLSGAHILRIEAALTTQLREFANAITGQLVKFESDHSPINLEDFEAAKSVIRKFKEECERAFRHRIDTVYDHFPKSREIFEDGKLELEFERSVNDIEGHRAVFASKISFWKWAMGDLKTRIWSGALVLLGSIAGAIGVWLFKAVL